MGDRRAIRICNALAAWTAEKNPDGLDENPARSFADPEVYRDRSVGVVAKKSAKADPEDPYKVGAPLPGLLASHVRAKGEIVAAGERLCVIEAMKMESSVTAPIGGRI